MIETAEARTFIEQAIDEMNEFSGHDQQIEKTDGFALLGSDVIDSLGFINLISSIESVIQEKTGKFITLVNEESLTGGDHPFATVGSLVEYVAKSLD